MIPLARHTLLELHGCDPALLASSDAIRPLLLEAVRAGGATIVTEIFHNFSPHGVSGVIVIAESNVAGATPDVDGFAQTCRRVVHDLVVEPFTPGPKCR